MPTAPTRQRDSDTCSEQRSEAPLLSVIVPTFNEIENVAPLLARLNSVLAHIPFEVIFADDNSPDGTARQVKAIARHDPRVRCIRRVGRRGLAGACIEGILSSSAPFVAVLDGDLQHDENLLSRMFQTLCDTEADIIVGSRYMIGGDAAAFAHTRALISRIANRAAQFLLGIRISDPMSGFFMMRRERFEAIAHKLSTAGFKILLDILVTGRGAFRVVEEPYIFRAREHGASKFDLRAALDFLSLLAAKLTGNIIDPRFVPYALVGTIGLLVHLLTLKTTLPLAPSFALAQVIATFAAMLSNFFLNNLVTYRDSKLHGLKMLYGLAGFCTIGLIGALANVGVAVWLYSERPVWWAAGAAGALVGAMWNFTMSSRLIWRTG